MSNQRFQLTAHSNSFEAIRPDLKPEGVKATATGNTFEEAIQHLQTWANVEGKDFIDWTITVVDTGNPAAATSNPIDEKLVAQCAVSVRRRRRVELRVVRQLLSDLRAAGYEVRADNGEDGAITGTDDQLVESLFAVDEATIRTRSVKGRGSSVFLVFGNDGWDTVNDYGISLEGTMAAFNDWCDKEREAGL